MGEQEPARIAGGDVKWSSCCGKPFGGFSKLNIELPCDPAMKTHVCTEASA